MNSQNRLPTSQQAIQDKCFHPTGKWEEFPRSALNGSIVTRFEEMVRRYPDRLAVKAGGIQLNYRELNEKANRLAHAILTCCSQEPEPIAFLLEQGVQAMVTIMGIHKSGHFYVALDPTYPTARLRTILDDVQTGLFVTNSSNLPLAQQLVAQSETILNIDTLSPQLSINNPNIHIRPGAIAYLIYTSGTTGRPKGVIETHRNVLSFTRIPTNVLHICPEDRVALAVSNSFSAAASKIYPALLNGATLYPFDPLIQGERAMSRWLRDEAITYFIYIPPPFRQLIATLDGTEQFPHLRVLGLGGDRIRPSDIVAYKKYFPSTCILRLVLGLSEKKLVTLYLLDHNTPTPSSVIPIGYPVEDTTVLLVNDEGIPVGPNEIGEIVVQSSYLSPGYWRQPELTAARFHTVQDASEMQLYYTGDLGKWNSNGALLHMGRKDLQVKIRGVRVEIAEIEGALRRLEDWKEVVVTATPDAQGEARLVAYLVPSSQPVPSTTVLRQQLATTLPDAMLPQAFVFLDELPLNVNNKIDHSALPLPDTSRPVLNTPYVPPSSSLEETLVETWKEILELDQVGIHDSFFELGGDSIRGMVFLNRIQKQFEITLHTPALFDASTVSEFAAYLMQYYPQFVVNKKASCKTELLSANSLQTSEIALLEQVLEDLEENVPVVSSETSILCRHDSGPAPLSFGQFRLWFVQQLESEQIVYSRVEKWRLSGSLNKDALQQALLEIARRHEPMRTKFVQQNGEPIQMVVPAEELSISTFDLHRIAEVEKNDVVQELFNEQTQKPFDLARELPWRFLLIQLHEREHILILTAHHIATDGWSWGVLKHELSQLYSAFVQNQPSPLPELPLQYVDFAVWQRQRLTENKLEQQLIYWRTQLAELSLLQLPLDYPRPSIQTFDNAKFQFDLPNHLIDGLRNIGQVNGATLFMTLLTAFKILLYRYSGQTDIVVGSPIVGRNRHELQSMIGLFINMLVLRTQFDQDDLTSRLTFVDLLHLVKKTAVDAYANQEVPFEKLVEELQPDRSLSYQPLFQVAFLFQNNPRQTLDLAGLDIEIMSAMENTSFDLTLNIRSQDESMQGELIYNSALFEATTIHRMAEHFQTLLHSIVANSETRICKLPLLTKSEYHRIVHEWNDTAIDFGEPQTFHALFEQQVKRTPDAIAVAFENEQLTYHELNQRANQLAHYLHIGSEGGEKSFASEFVVGVYMDRCPEMVVSLLAIMKAGGVYLPLDPMLPQGRIAYMLTHAKGQVVLTQHKHTVYLTEVIFNSISDDTIKLIDVDTDMAIIALQSALNPSNYPAQEYLAYTIYTSGSTGLPKGAMVEHQGMVNHLYAMVHDLELTEKDKIAETAPQSFDISIWQFLTGLLVGGMVHIFDDETVRNPAQLLAQTEAEQITVLEVVPSLFRLMLEELAIAENANNRDRPPFAALRWLLLTGEALPPHLCNEWLRYYPNIPLINAYGPAECSDDITLHFIHKPLLPNATSTPIGRPIANTKLYILDHYLQPVPVGVPGELYVGGIGVGRGYLNDPERTDQAFLDDPLGQRQGRFYKTGDLVRYQSDGVIEFLGRADFQVKIRGFRIELGEIENALLTQNCVREAVVLAREENDDKRLVAYVVRESESHDVLTARPNDQTILRQALAQQLPDYMIPSAFVFLEAMPLSSNGKLDRLALPAPEYVDTESEFVAPSTQMETQLAEIWSELLQIEHIGIHDNFFELGGHSLLTVKLMMQIERQFDATIFLKDFFAGPTITHLATWLVEADDETETQFTDAKDVKQNILTPKMEKLYDSIGVPGAMNGLMQPSGGRRWYLIHHALQKLPHNLRLILIRQLTQGPMRGWRFNKTCQLITQFLTAIETEVDETLALESSLIYGILHKYKINMVQSRSKSDIVEKIEKARSSTQGVLLIGSHHSMQFWFQRIGIVEAHIGGVHHLTPQHDPNYATITDMLFTRQVDHARKILQQGGVAQIAADGQHGKGRTLEYDFHGRRRPFLTGFAELALATDAQVIPLTYGVTTTGNPIRDISTPLDADDRSLPHGERVERLVSQYVALLRQMWSKTPWIVPWYQMERHLAYPTRKDI